MIIKKAHDAYIFDEFNNQYIDTSMGSGSQIIGHGNILSRKIAKQIEKGTIYTIPNHHTGYVNELLKKYITPTLHDKYVFCNSGTEANMRAIRLARAFTKRNKIGRFHGGWHGGLDGFIESQGVPAQTNENIEILPYNDEDCFARITSEFAAVIFEPVQGSNPRTDICLFLKRLEKECRKKNVLLIADEILTGFRLAKRGGCEIFDLSPDIVTFGKVLGGGFPIGALGAKEKIMSTPDVFYGGTFSANPLSMYAATQILEDITQNKTEKPLIDYDKLNHLGEYFRNTLNSFFIDNSFSIRVFGCNSVNRLIFTDKPIRNRRERDLLESKNQKQFYKSLVKEGIFINTNGIIHLSMCHLKLIDKIIHKIKKVSRND
jgi:glutamate-1-semialdehyde 2,1-aminomutase